MMIEKTELFSMAVPQFEITDLPGTSKNSLCILGSKYVLPTLVAFMYLHVKY